MPEWPWLLILFLSIAVSAFAGCYVAFRCIIHILDKWMR